VWAQFLQDLYFFELTYRYALKQNYTKIGLINLPHQNFSIVTKLQTE